MPRNGPNGCFSVNTTVRVVGRFDLVDLHHDCCGARGWVCFSNSIENSTSAEVNGLPSCQVTPGLSLKV